MNRWPVFLAAGLTVVVLVNLAMIWIAIETAPDVEPSYSQTQDR